MNENNLSFFNLLKIVSACMISFFLHWNYAFIHRLEMSINNPILSTRMFRFLLGSPVRLSVELFFIISGFLFAYIYIPRIRKREYTFDKFIFKRYIRIMPLVVLTPLVCYILTFITRINDIKCWESFCRNKVDTVSLIYDFLFSGIQIINNNNFSLNVPIWYTSVLLICYILAYVITQIYIRFSNKSIFILPIILGIIIFETGWQKPLLTTGAVRGYIAFFEGIILYFLISKVNKLEKQTKKKLIFISLFIFTILFRYVYLNFENYTSYVSHKNIVISNMFVFFDFIIYPPLLYMLYNFKWLNDFCNTRIIKYLGKISYGIYL